MGLPDLSYGTQGVWLRLIGQLRCIFQMLVGVVAFNTLRVIEPDEPRALGVLLTGYIFQGMSVAYHFLHSLTILSGLGFFMTFFYICIYILR